MKFNLSASSLNLYLESQLRFYYVYIEKADPDTEVPQVYGTAGNIVHEALEYFAKKLQEIKSEQGGVDLRAGDAVLFYLQGSCFDCFDDAWKDKKIDQQKGMWIPSRQDYHRLGKSKYLICVHRGIKLLEEKYKDPVPEELIEIQYNTDVKIKGIIDLPCQLDGDTVIVDWKTSSKVDNGGAFERQGLFYCMLYYIKHGILPKKVIFEYLKIDKVKEYVFGLDEVLDFQCYLANIIHEITQKGNDISNYEVGKYDSPFNQHKIKCHEQHTLRKGTNKTMEMDLEMVDKKGRYLKAEEIKDTIKDLEWGVIQLSKIPPDTSFAVTCTSELQSNTYVHEDEEKTSHFIYAVHEEIEEVKKIQLSAKAVERFKEKNPDVTLIGETILLARTKYIIKDDEGKPKTVYPQFINLVKNKVDRKGKPSILRTPKDEDIMAITEKYKVALVKMLEDGKQVDYKKHYIGAIVNKLMPELGEKLGKIYDEHVKGDSDSLL